MDKGLRPIPALYACYLLRSTVRHGSLYVGSTPDPVRRLRQHNGGVKGGAVRTSKDTLRPWEVTCLVTGFPSKIAALQFEWAWQNTHLTRHIAADIRVTQAKAKVRISPKSGKIRRRTARPRLSLTDRIANLHLLLQASSFERWPLRVTFYVSDVYRMWERWLQRHSEPIASHIEVVLDVTNAPDEQTPDQPALTGISALQVDYSIAKAHLEKSRTLFPSVSTRCCAICSSAVPTDGAGTLVCSGDGCKAVTHLGCLSQRFLHNEKIPALVPTLGHCPACSQKLIWFDLVRELTLRMRGGAEIAKLFKVPRLRKKHGAVNDQAADGAAVLDEEIPPENGLEDDTLADDWHVLTSSEDSGLEDELQAT